MSKSRTLRFTRVTIDKLKPPESGRVDYSNAAIPGMQLRVSASGKMVYRVKTRINGEQQAMTIGNTAVLTLAEANKRAKEFLAAASAGINPVAERRRKEAEAVAADTVERVMIDRYFPLMARKMRPRTFKERQRALRYDVLPKLGATPIDKLTRRQIRDVIGEICARGHEPHAAHILAFTRAFLNWAVHEDIIIANPAAGIPDPDSRRKEDRERDRWLNDQEIALFWVACNRVGGIFGPFFQLLLLFGCRLSELVEAPWAEFDLERRQWLLSARRSKNGNEHLTHISEPALAILRALQPPHERNPASLLFSTTGRTPFSNFNRPMARITAEMSAKAGREIAPFTRHDLRRSLATGLAELGVSEHVVDRVLNHSGRRVSGVARIYNRSEYLKERQSALDLWGEHVMDLVRPKEVGDAHSA